MQIEDQQQPIRVGASIGIGIVPHDDKDLARVIALADNAMYLSKTERQPYVLVEALCNHET